MRGMNRGGLEIIQAAAFVYFKDCTVSRIGAPPRRPATIGRASIAQLATRAQPEDLHVNPCINSVPAADFALRLLPQTAI
jgi:hypothetical protein